MNNKVISIINERIVEEEDKYKHYTNKYLDTFEKYKDCNDGLLKIKLVPVWRKMIKSEYRLGALNDILNTIFLFDNGEVNFNVCDTMIDCDDCGGCEYRDGFVDEINRKSEHNFVSNVTFSDDLDF